MSDYTLEDTIYLKFTTRQFSTGAPFTLAGTPAVSAYENDSVTQITAGITLNADFDSVTGLNHLTIAATAANGYETGKDYDLVITTGTVDSVSVVGEVVGHFSLGRSAAAVDLANGTDGLGAIKTDTAAILVDTAEIGAAGAGLTEAGGTGDHLTAIPWNPAWDAEVQSEVNDALVAIHLDHAFAVDYDPASKPGTATALWNELVESDGGVSRFTANALEQGPSGTSSNLLQNTTIATLASQTSFTLTAGSADDDAYNGAMAIVTDSATSAQKAVGRVSDYTGSTKTVTLAADPGIFTMATGDTIDIVAVPTRIDANMVAISGATAPADQLELSANTIVPGTAQTGTLSTTQMSTDLTEATDDHYIGRAVIWTSGALQYQASNITDYAGTNGVLTYDTVTEAPANGDTFIIV